MTEVRMTSRGCRLRNFPGWPGWVFEVDVDRTGRARAFRQVRPPRARSKGPQGDERRRIEQAAEAMFGHGTGFLAVDLVVASRPRPHGTHNTAERAKTVAMVYGTALGQGLSPYKVLSEVYGLEPNARGNIIEYSTTVERWVGQARKFGFLAPYDPDDPGKFKPRRWPGRPAHRLEASRAEPMLPERKLEGPSAGRLLTVQCRPVATLDEIDDDGDPVTDVEITAHWADGQPLGKTIEPLRSVTLAEIVKTHLVQLTARLESEYSGARVQATLVSTTIQPRPSS